MFGDDLLVAPVLEPGLTAWTVYLPGPETWVIGSLFALRSALTCQRKCKNNVDNNFTTCNDNIKNICIWCNENDDNIFKNRNENGDNILICKVHLWGDDEVTGPISVEVEAPLGDNDDNDDDYNHYHIIIIITIMLQLL